jgi:hypothetical protein
MPRLFLHSIYNTYEGSSSVQQYEFLILQELKGYNRINQHLGVILILPSLPFPSRQVLSSPRDSFFNKDMVIDGIGRFV